MILRGPSTAFTILLLLVYVAGLATMSLEFSVSRLLIPIFGSTIYTWGSLIGVVLVGLSGGYHLGGRLADKNPNFEKFCSKRTYFGAVKNFSILNGGTLKLLLVVFLYRWSFCIHGILERWSFDPVP